MEKSTESLSVYTTNRQTNKTKKRIKNGLPVTLWDYVTPPPFPSQPHTCLCLRPPTRNPTLGLVRQSYLQHSEGKKTQKCLISPSAAVKAHGNGPFGSGGRKVKEPWLDPCCSSRSGQWLCPSAPSRSSSPPSQDSPPRGHCPPSCPYSYPAVRSASCAHCTHIRCWVPGWGIGSS